MKPKPQIGDIRVVQRGELFLVQRKERFWWKTVSTEYREYNAVNCAHFMRQERDRERALPKFRIVDSEPGRDDEAG